MPAPPTRRLSPALALTLLAGIGIIGFTDRIIMNVLVEPVKAQFGLSDTEIGLVNGLAFALLNIILGLVVARVAERSRRLTLVAIGTFFWSLATAATGMAQNFVQLLLARIGVGVGEAVGLPATGSVIADYFPPSRSARRRFRCSTCRADRCLDGGHGRFDHRGPLGLAICALCGSRAGADSGGAASCVCGRAPARPARCLWWMRMRCPRCARCCGAIGSAGRCVTC
jgi:hypothetical protein